jgi:DNA-binding Lrp family transcriptional regulator
MKIAEKDLRILEELKKNSRISLRELSLKTSLKPSTLHIRIQKMLDKGIIKNFTINPDYDQLGINLIAFLLVSTDKNLNSLRDDSFVEELFRVTGENDYLIKLRFKNMDQFNEFVFNFKKHHKPNKIITMLATKDLKG